MITILLHSTQFSVKNWKGNYNEKGTEDSKEKENRKQNSWNEMERETKLNQYGGEMPPKNIDRYVWIDGVCSD